MERVGQDALALLRGHRLIAEVAHHPPPVDNLLELHSLILPSGLSRGCSDAGAIAVGQSLTQPDSNDEQGDADRVQRELSRARLVERRVVTGSPGIPDDEQ